MTEHAATALLRFSLLFSLCSLMVLALRWPLLRRFGVRAAYQAWLLLPAMLGAALLPQAALTQALRLELPATLLSQPALGMPAAAGGAAPVQAYWWLWLWAFGVLLHALLMLWQQRRFQASLHTGHGHGVNANGPALVGLWRPRIWLPDDFEQRYCADERALIVAHEQIHAQRHDNHWNLLAAALCGLQWFNPLAWWALARMRADQELSCDAMVMALRPDARAVYAKALVKAQCGSTLPAVWCQWQSSHPLIERVAMLQSHNSFTARLQAGRIVLLLAALLGLSSVYALQPLNGEPVPQAGRSSIALGMQISLDGQLLGSPRLHTEEGVRAEVKLGAPAAAPEHESWAVSVAAHRMSEGRLRLDTVIHQGREAEPLAQPVLIVAEGQAAAIELSSRDGKHRLRLDINARLLPMPDTETRPQSGTR